MEFDGVNDYVDINDNASLDTLTANFTISAWVAPDTFGAWRFIYQSGTQTNYWAVGLEDTGDGHIDFSEHGIADYISTSAISDSNWHHIVVVKDGIVSHIRFYLDGTADGTASVGTVATPSGAKRIGRESNGASPFNGLIDEVYVYNYALSADQINTLYNQGQAAVMGDDASRDNDGTAVTGKSKEYCIPGDTARCDPPVRE